MRILIDIGHPAHVHYFKNFIWEMKSKGHEFLITAREKDITHQLLNKYNMEFISRGKGKKGFLGKLIYMLQADFKLFRIARRFNPDTFISCASPYAAHSAKLLKVQNITLDDTDIANLSHIMYVPFTDCIISPKGFKKNFGKKHILIDSTFDLFYLHPKYFTPNSLVKED